MNKSLLVLVLALVSGCLAFCVVRWHEVSAHHAESILDVTPGLEWLRRDLNLTDEQTTKVHELLESYRPQCVEMHRRIALSHSKMEGMAKRGREISPEFAAALREHAEIHVESQQIMLTHLYKTAAVLDERQAVRYLETMLPYALEFTHSEPGNLHGH